MQTELASQIILANMKNIADGSSDDRSASITLSQIKLWLVPQKAEHDLDYDINGNYFDSLLRNALDELLAGGYITSSINESIEDGDPQTFSLTVKGAKYIEELVPSYEGT
ncbi:MAG: hypothetical protein ACREA4_11525 [Nitrososphaera sp.]